MTKRAAYFAPLIALSLILSGPVLAASDMQPGESTTYTCPTEITGTFSPNEVTLTCAPTDVATPSASASPSPVPTASPVASSSPSPSPTSSPVTPAPTASPSPTPTSTPTPTTPPSGSVPGYGSGTVGGNSQPVERPATLAALRSALTSCPCNIQLPETAQTWDLNGQNLTIGQSNTTLDGGAIVFKDGGIVVQASQVILRDIRGRSGDAQGNGNDLDAVSVNARTGRLSNIVWDRVEALWGPDVSGTILGAVSDMTIRHSIIGEGLFRSSHPESGDSDGHSLAFNLTQLSNNIDSPARITIVESLIPNSQGRMPQFADGGPYDLIDSVIFGMNEGPQGNPHRGLNIVGSVYIKLPDRPVKWTNVFRGRVHSGGAGPQTLCTGCVYWSDVAYEGYTLTGPTPASMTRSTPLVPLSVASKGSAITLARVLASAGAAPRDSTTNRILDDLRNRDAQYINGTGHSAPNPSWP